MKNYIKHDKRLYWGAKLYYAKRDPKIKNIMCDKCGYFYYPKRRWIVAIFIIDTIENKIDYEEDSYILLNQVFSPDKYFFTRKECQKEVNKMNEMEIFSENLVKRNINNLKKKGI